MFELWAGTQTVDQQDRTEKYINGNVRRLELWAVQRLGDHRIDLVTENVVSDYMEWRLAQPRKPALSTLRNERTALNQLFKFAKRKGYIREIPEIRIKSGRQASRPDIPEAEWHRLCGYMDHYISSAQDRRRHRERLYLARYILVLANTGIRVGEARKVRWRDVSETRTLTGDVRIVLTVRGKTGEREVVCNEGVNQYLRDLLEFRQAELSHAPDLNEFIFCRRDGGLTGSFKKGLYRVLNEAGVL